MSSGTNCCTASQLSRNEADWALPSCNQARRAAIRSRWDTDSGTWRSREWAMSAVVNSLFLVETDVHRINNRLLDFSTDVPLSAAGKAVDVKVVNDTLSFAQVHREDIAPLRKGG